jgi:hypothetical protein
MRPDPSTPSAGVSRRSRSRSIRALLLGLALVAVLVAVLGVWYIFFRPAGPPAIAPGAPVIPAGAVSSPAALSSPAAVLSPLDPAVPTATPDATLIELPPSTSP